MLARCVWTAESRWETVLHCDWTVCHCDLNASWASVSVTVNVNVEGALWGQTGVV